MNMNATLCTFPLLLAAGAGLSPLGAQCTTLDYTVTNYGAGQLPSAATLGDFDGDGDEDIAVTSSQPPFATNLSVPVTILLNRGDGAFEAPLTFDGGTDPLDVTSGDMDGDGDLDLVIADHGYFNFGSNTWQNFGLQVLLNDGTGNFATSIFYPFDPGHEEPFAVALGDLDGDGNLDVVTAIANAGFTLSEVAVRLGDGAGGLLDPTFQPVGLFPTDVAVVDIDGDGFLDVATADGRANSVSLFFGDGSGVLNSISDALFVPTTPVRLAFGDLDQDGDLDLAVTQKFGITVLRNVGNRSFASITTLSAGLRPHAVEMVDLDKDLDVDLVATNYLGDSLDLYVNDGTGNLTSTATILQPDTPLAVLAADLDDDSDIDLVVANYSSQDVAVLTSTCESTILSADVGTISLSAGGTQTLSLDAGSAHAGESFVVAGSLAGTLPGFDVGGVHVPLNQDAYFQLTLNLGGVPPFIGFAGTLDANGKGTAQFSLPPGTPGVLAGLTIHHAFATLAPGVNFASNAVSVSLLP